MTFETLVIIHDLLKKHHELCEINAQTERVKLDQAYRILEETESNPDCGPGAVEEANLALEACKAAKRKAVDEMCATKRALDEFETHEWH